MHYKEQKARQDDTLTWFMLVCVACRPGKMTHSPGVCLSVWHAGQAGWHTHLVHVCLCGVQARQDDTLTWFMFVCVVCRPGKMTHSPGVCLCGVQARQDDTHLVYVWRASQAG